MSESVKSAFAFARTIYKGHPIAFLVILSLALFGFYIDRHPQVAMLIVSTAADSVSVMMCVMLALIVAVWTTVRRNRVIADARTAEIQAEIVTLRKEVKDCSAKHQSDTLVYRTAIGKLILLIAEDRCKDSVSRRTKTSEIMHWIDTQLAGHPVPPREDYFNRAADKPKRFYEQVD